VKLVAIAAKLGTGHNAVQEKIGILITFCSVKHNFVISNDKH
jgi:hypothetical protein